MLYSRSLLQISFCCITIVTLLQSFPSDWPHTYFEKRYRKSSFQEVLVKCDPSLSPRGGSIMTKNTSKTDTKEMMGAIRRPQCQVPVSWSIPEEHTNPSPLRSNIKSVTQSNSNQPDGKVTLPPEDTGCSSSIHLFSYCQPTRRKVLWSKTKSAFSYGYCPRICRRWWPVRWLRNSPPLFRWNLPIINRVSNP